MRASRRPLIPVIIVVILAAAVGGYFILRSTTQNDGLIVSGTIEATEIHLGSQTGGIANQVYASEGENVTKGEVLADIQPASGVSTGFR